MTKQQDIDMWMKRAKSNLIRAKADKVSDEVFYEDLCFDAQQCVEKALKALCLYRDVIFPKTHSIFHLIDLLENNVVKIPLKITLRIGTVRLFRRYQISGRFTRTWSLKNINGLLKLLKISMIGFQRKFLKLLNNFIDISRLPAYVYDLKKMNF